MVPSSCERQEEVPESNSLTGHDSLQFTEKGHELIITSSVCGFGPAAPSVLRGFSTRATSGVCQRRFGVDEGVRGTDKLMEIKVTEWPQLSPVSE